LLSGLVNALLGLVANPAEWWCGLPTWAVSSRSRIHDGWHKCLFRRALSELARAMLQLGCHRHQASDCQIEKGTGTMIKLIDQREIAASLAGAFVATLLFVSAAIGPLPLA
jgi:hypothetical protein